MSVQILLNIHRCSYLDCDRLERAHALKFLTLLLWIVAKRQVI